MTLVVLFSSQFQDSFDSRSTPVKDTSVKAYHTFNDMRYYKFPLANGTTVQTCPAALGYGFAAGTTDGPGPFDFTQGNNDSNVQNPLWQVVSGLLRTPTEEQKKVSYPVQLKSHLYRTLLTHDTVSIAQANSARRW